jgi:Peptidase family S41/N-terminal domain of Peptidase_S41 in eukaryotic IRBP
MLRLVRTGAGMLLAAATLLPVDVDAQTPLTAADRRAVLLGTADLIEDRYVIEDTARALADQLRRDATADRWRDKSDPEAFAAAITAHLRSASGDGHLGLSYRATPLTGEVVADERTYTAEEMDRWYGPHLNYGFEQVRRFDGNVGYLDLRVFAPTSTAGDVAAAVMTVLAQSAALIIDLRENGGGHGDMAHLLAAYLLNESKPMSGGYDRPSDIREWALTPSWVPGRRYGIGRPVYVLISKRTFSAAEGFAYDLQALRRVTVVGERSGGGAHPFKYRRVHPHFVLSLAEGRSINPITGGNWQGTGVVPDVEVPADRALETALTLAREAIAARSR